MLRNVLAVVGGWFVMTAWVMLTSMLAWKVLGSSFALNESQDAPSGGWIAINLVLGFLGAGLGGFVTAGVARNPTNRPVMILAVLLLAMGLGSAMSYRNQAGAPEDEPLLEVADEATTPAETIEPDYSSPDPGDGDPDYTDPADGELSFSEAASRARPPVWYGFFVPFVGAAGVVAGGRYRQNQLRAAGELGE